MLKHLSKLEVCTALAKNWGIYKQTITASYYEYFNTSIDNTGLIDYLIENEIVYMQ